MTSVAIEQLRRAVETHGGRATFSHIERVFHPGYDVNVAVFRLEGHESADTAFAWWKPDDASGDDETAGWLAVLEVGEIQTAVDAVRHRERGRRPGAVGVRYHHAVQTGEIRRLARACKRDALSKVPPGGVVDGMDPAYFARLEQMLGRPYTDDEAFAFRIFFETSKTGLPA